MKIGVIDSGIGGITTLREVMKSASADYYYFLDEGNLPYSKKSNEELFDISKSIIDKLSILGIDLVVIACNTLTSAAAAKLRKTNSIPIIGIEPALKPALKNCKRVVTLATSATLCGDKYIKLKSGATDTDVVDVNGDGLQERIERGDISEAERYLDELLKNTGDIDGIVLGCTHYVYLKDHIEALGVRTFDGNAGVARRVKNIAKDLEHCSDTIESGDMSVESKNDESKSSLKNRLVKSNCKKSRVFIHSTGKLPLESISNYLKSCVFLW